MKKAYLVLSDGRKFEGVRIGADKDAAGELVFTTGVVGYLETLTDPSCAGQIVMQTFPQIGNYGVIGPDAEGACAASGYVVRELCDAPSNFRCEMELNGFLEKNGVPGIAGVDTREITRILREEGTLFAKIVSELPDDIGFEGCKVQNAVEKVSAKSEILYPAIGEKKFGITAVDYGTSNSLIANMCSRGCEVRIVPHDTKAKEIMEKAPDGVLLTGGPGDPAENASCIAEISKLIGRVPVLGVGLGHQMAALAMGGETAKLKYGHRGANQPVKKTDGARTYITSQNHGYIVEKLPEGAVMTYINANDGTCEGIFYPGKNCITVQFTPDGGGLSGTGYIFDEFISMMEAMRNA